MLNNRNQLNLLKIFKDNVASNNMDDLDEDNINEVNLVNTRVYSDCFRAYQPNTFRDKGYILKHVNRSVFFGYGDFHTNPVEGLWSQLKRITHYFSGISITKFSNMFNNDNDKINYLNGWITYALLIREFERNRLSRNRQINLLCSYLKI